LRNAGLSPELLQQATRPALRRGLVVRDELGDADRSRRPEEFLEQRARLD